MFIRNAKIPCPTCCDDWYEPQQQIARKKRWKFKRWFVLPTPFSILRPTAAGAAVEIEREPYRSATQSQAPVRVAWSIRRLWISNIYRQVTCKANLSKFATTNVCQILLVKAAIFSLQIRSQALELRNSSADFSRPLLSRAVRSISNRSGTQPEHALPTSWFTFGDIFASRNILETAGQWTILLHARFSVLWHWNTSQWNCSNLNPRTSTVWREKTNRLNISSQWNAKKILTKWARPNRKPESTIRWRRKHQMVDSYFRKRPTTNGEFAIEALLTFRVE